MFFTNFSIIVVSEMVIFYSSVLFDDFLPNVQLKDILISTTGKMCAEIIHLSHIVALIM